eukprot:6180220-Pleurochrysis_carterae.AAC.2
MAQRRHLKARQLHAKSSTAAYLRRFTMFAVSSMQMRRVEHADAIIHDFGISVGDYSRVIGSLGLLSALLVLGVGPLIQ